MLFLGSDKAFCVGQDLVEHARILEETPEQALSTVREHYNPVVLGLESIQVPVVVGIGGVLELLCEGCLTLELGLARLRVQMGARLQVRVDNARGMRGPTEELLLEVLLAKNGDFGEQELTLDAVRLRVVEHGPYGYLWE